MSGSPEGAVVTQDGRVASRPSSRGQGARPVRVAHLVSHPIQYYVPLYRELASRREIDLTVYYYSIASAGEFYDPGFGRVVRWDTPLLGGYRSRICPSATRAGVGAGWRRWPNWDVAREVANGQYDVVWIHGYNHPTSLLSALLARLAGARLMIREDQTLLHPRSWRRELREVRGAAGPLQPGDRAVRGDGESALLRPVRHAGRATRRDPALRGQSDVS